MGCGQSTKEEPLNAVVPEEVIAKQRNYQVRCRHILFKHEGSKNPVSHRTGKSTLGIKKEDAFKLACKWQWDVKNKAAYFDTSASSESDCSSYKLGGDLGWFGHGEMMRPFEDAVYALKIREISEVVSTECGFHVIERTG